MAENKADNKIDIPIQRTDLSIFDETISSVKEKFIAEIKKIDEEMNKFSSDLLGIYAQTSKLRVGVASANESIEEQSPSKGQANWESLLSSPFVEKDGNNKTLKLQFDVSQFDPSEVTVHVINNTLVLSASHEQQTDSSIVSRQYYREFKIPNGIDLTAINSTLSKDGVLTVVAPLPQLAITLSDGRSSPSTRE